MLQVAIAQWKALADDAVGIGETSHAPLAEDPQLSKRLATSSAPTSILYNHRRHGRMVLRLRRRRTDRSTSGPHAGAGELVANVVGRFIDVTARPAGRRARRPCSGKCPGRGQTPVHLGGTALTRTTGRALVLEVQEGVHGRVDGVPDPTHIAYSSCTVREETARSQPWTCLARSRGLPDRSRGGRVSTSDPHRGGPARRPRRGR